MLMLIPLNSMKKFVIALVVVVVAGVGWYLVSPLFIDNVVDEDFPVVTDTLPTDQPDSVAADGGDMMKDGNEEMADQQEPDYDEMMKKMETLTREEVEAMPEEEQEKMKEQMNDLAKEMADTVMEDEMPTGPVALKAGTFKDADLFHKGSGEATVYELETGQRLVRFEDFAVTNGPALSVFLVKTTDGTKGEGAIDLGKLKGNKGSQNYDIPIGVNLDEYSSVLIYCVPFVTPFAYAPLS